MNLCSLRESYLDRCLEPQMERSFEAHLKQCVACQSAVTRWRAIQNGLNTWKETAAELKRTPQSVNRLLERVREKKVGATFLGSYRFLLIAAVGATILLALGAVVALLFSVKKSALETRPGNEIKISAQLFSFDNSAAVTITQPISKPLLVPLGKRVRTRLGPDTIGIGPGSQLKVEKHDPSTTRLTLMRGSVACAVHPKGEGRTFFVLANPYVVRVKGTRFLVHRDVKSIVTISVTRGTVEVSGPKAFNQRVVAGHALRLPKAGGARLDSITDSSKQDIEVLLSKDHFKTKKDMPQPRKVKHSRHPRNDKKDFEDKGERISPLTHKSSSSRRDFSHNLADGTKKKQPDFFTWRKWILQRNYARAELALLAYLKQSPRDTTARSLLADCQRKAGKWEQAVMSYSKIAASADSFAANRARLIAATILQDRLWRYQDAAKLLEAYLQSAHTRVALEAEASVRLARAYLKLKKVDQAVRLLQRVASQYAGTATAIEARRILKTIGHEAK